MVGKYNVDKHVSAYGIFFKQLTQNTNTLEQALYFVKSMIYEHVSLEV